MMLRTIRHARWLTTGLLVAAAMTSAAVLVPATASAAPVPGGHQSTVLIVSSGPASSARTAEMRETIRIARAAARQAAVPTARSAAQPAASLPNAFNEKTQVLTGQPTTSDPPSCVSRTIGLIPHGYEFLEFINNMPAVTIVSKEPIQVDGVNEASFHWTSCLFPENGFYDFNTALVADGDGSTVTLANTLTLAIKGLHTYTWGSELAPDTFGTV